MALKIVVLGAGAGTRMYSKTPKVLHKLAGIPLVEHVLTAAAALSPESIIFIHGHQSEVVQQALTAYDMTWVLQDEQLGTGHAVQQALPFIEPDDMVIVLYADVPLLSAQTLQALAQHEPNTPLCLLTAHFADPFGLGRIVRDPSGEIVCIVEHKDANEKEKEVKEIYSGVMRVRGDLLHEFLPNLSKNNSQGEYYLTEIIAMTIARGSRVTSIVAPNEEEVMGVNTRLQLSHLERYYHERRAKEFIHQGVTLLDPKRFDCRGTAKVAQDVTIDINVILENSEIAEGAIIGPNCYIKDSIIGKHVEIKANSVIDGAIIEDACVVGPFARIRPQTTLKQGVKVGNFVELKQSLVNQGSKINHLSYVGDAIIGKQVNIGAGTITCNYDGANKHQTVIEDNVHIGSDTQLIAPIRIGAGATIAAGATVRKDAPPDALTLSKSEQKTLTGWKRPEKKI